MHATCTAYLLDLNTLVVFGEECSHEAPHCAVFSVPLLLRAGKSVCGSSLLRSTELFKIGRCSILMKAAAILRGFTKVC
jgi:hypothetical protein